MRFRSAPQRKRPPPPSTPLSVVQLITPIHFCVTPELVFDSRGVTVREIIFEKSSVSAKGKFRERGDRLLPRRGARVEGGDALLAVAHSKILKLPAKLADVSEIMLNSTLIKVNNN